LGIIIKYNFNITIKYQLEKFSGMEALTKFKNNELKNGDSLYHTIIPGEWSVWKKQKKTMTVLL